MKTNHSGLRPVVHLELHTPDQSAASAFYATLLRWRPELIDTHCGSYLALELGVGIGGGIVECGTQRALWLPYVEVDEIDKQTERARQVGAHVLLEPQEGRPGGVAWCPPPGRRDRLLAAKAISDPGASSEPGQLGAPVTLECAAPAGWRQVVLTLPATELALRQPKR